ncbi:MAG TPA: succinate dehydrogenase, cytochrome b556 subunit [Acetobacteraceae bacterium]|nr:succinate dehydrogenase, cytochrome b556 subunit [Acetobacteraceae bacterium]
MKDVRDALLTGRRSDGKLVERPLSPHLQVYKWPVSMMLSISHRATGIGVSVGALLMTWWLVAAATSDAAFATVQGFLGSGFGVFLLFCWAAALLLHLFQGIRHLVWDAGYGFDNRSYRITGWGVIAITVVATLIVWIVGLVVW